MRNFLVLFMIWHGDPAAAHVSERALVLLLPTDVYSAVGVILVALTVLWVTFWPAGLAKQAPTIQPSAAQTDRYSTATSLASCLIFWTLIALGLFGPRDPLSNLLPLTIFALWWICFPPLQALFGDIWHWINPWRGPATLIFRAHTPHLFPIKSSVWPAIFIYILAGVFALTDIAPTDPTRLAYVAAAYWLFSFAMIGLFGPIWLQRGEAFTVFFTLIARLSRRRSRLTTPTIPLAIFCVTLLAIGSFDGLNETFWWIVKLGINPLEFTGRSAVIWPNRLGMLGAIILLNVVFAATVWIGLVLISRTRDFHRLYCQLAITLLPIALGYHVAHLLTAAQINLQYFVLALSDPLDTGANYLGLNFRYVTTGFLNNLNSVRIIWFVQGSAIVIGHMLAILMAHTVALDELDNRKQATISQIPISIFMVLYTLFGLWLLSSPTAF